MYILGIESSCDETAAALVDREGRVAVSLIASQVDLHARYGGVVPEEAARVHIQACMPLVEEALTVAGVSWEKIHAIAVTFGPGLIGCLLVGVETAKALAWARSKPLIAANHLCGHLHAIHLAPRCGAHRLFLGGQPFPVYPIAPFDLAQAEKDGSELKISAPGFPHVGLIVSGGHTSLVLVEAPGQVTTLAQTLDDAAGECYDKVARVAGLGYPGGPLIDQLAADGNPDVFKFPTPLLRRDRPDFSFSGLKTSAGRAAEKLVAEHRGQIPPTVLRDWCAGVQRAVVDVLIEKSLDAVRAQRLNDVVITGGVASNRGLRARACEASRRHRQLRFWFPHPSVCTDNAAMIAGLGWHLAPLPPEQARALNANAGLVFPLAAARA
jgi:N6-L-threonylcarbamoyladenine synthase